MTMVNKPFGDIITFTRSSTGTYFDANGVLQQAAVNAPRFDYDPVTGEPLGILIEEQRTNLLLRSSEFSDAVWQTSVGVSKELAAEAPVGPSLASYKITPSTGGTFIELFQWTPSTSGTVYTSTYFVKSAGLRYVQIVGSTGAFGTGYVNFDLSDGVITAKSDGNTQDFNATIEKLNDGWRKINVTTKALASVSNYRHALNFIKTATTLRGVDEGAFDGTSGLFVCAAQLEAGAFPTSYIPTEASQVTRAADVCIVNTLSPWYNASEGTIFARVRALTLTSDKAAFDLSDNTASNRSRVILVNGGTLAAFLTVGAVQQAAPSGFGAYNTGAASRVAVAHAINNYAVCANGGAVVTDTSNGTFTATTLSLGRTYNGAGLLNGYIQSIEYYPRRLSSTELQDVTA